MTTRIKKTSELTKVEKRLAPAATLIGGVGGFALEVCFGRPVAEGIVTGIISAGLGAAAGYYLPRLEDIPDVTPPTLPKE